MKFHSKCANTFSSRFKFLNRNSKSVYFRHINSHKFTSSFYCHHSESNKNKVLKRKLHQTNHKKKKNGIKRSNMCCTNPFCFCADFDKRTKLIALSGDNKFMSVNSGRRSIKNQLPFFVFSL
jgi:hypothetical protein